MNSTPRVCTHAVTHHHGACAACDQVWAPRWVGKFSPRRSGEAPKRQAFGVAPPCFRDAATGRRRSLFSASILLALVFTLLSLFSSLSAFAQPETDALPAAIRYENVRDPDDIQEAQAFATTWLAENAGFLRRYRVLRANNPTLPLRPVVPITHVGDDIPRNIRWVTQSLVAAGYDVDVKLINEDVALDELEAQRAESAERLSVMRYGAEAESVRSEALSPGYRDSAMVPAPAEAAAAHSSAFQIARTRIHEMFGRMRLRGRELIGTPLGFTLWPKLDLDAATVRADRRNAYINTSIAIVTTATGFAMRGVDVVPILRACVGTGFWVYINIANGTKLSKFMGQGTILREVVTKAGEIRWAIDKNPFFSRVVVYARSMIANAIVFSCLYGPDDAFDEGRLVVAATNSLFTLFSRFWFEEWLQKHQATTDVDGKLVTEEGQHAPQQTARYRFWFENINGLMKVMHLAGVPYANMIFPASGIVGAYFNARKTWPSAVRSFRRFIGWASGATPKNCATYLETPKTGAAT